MITVTSVEYITVDKQIYVYDLTVEDDHSFLLNNGVIAHNSSICLGRHGLRYTVGPEHEPIGHSIPYLNGVPYHPS